LLIRIFSLLSLGICGGGLLTILVTLLTAICLRLAISFLLLSRRLLGGGVIPVALTFRLLLPGRGTLLGCLLIRLTFAATVWLGVATGELVLGITLAELLSVVASLRDLPLIFLRTIIAGRPA
jgi:hypothetical protein